MDRALALIAGRLPCPAAQIEAELREQGLTTVGLAIENVAIGAQLLGRPVGFKIVDIQGRRRGSAKGIDGRLVVRPDQANVVMAVADLVKKEIYFHGLATVEQIQAAISARCGEGPRRTWCGRPCC